MNIFKRLSIAFLFVGLAQTATAQLYTKGDIVENFTLTNRATGEPVTLHDFEGKIVFLEWFAHWCPFCQAAAARVGPDIVNYYGPTNRNGVPFMHVAVNLVAGAETQTQSFINFYGLEYVAEDFTRSVSGRFSTNGQPIFAIINGTANSSRHQQWELLYSRSGYNIPRNENQEYDYSEYIQDFRTAIDSVMPASVIIDPPTISQQPASLTVPKGDSFSLNVTAASEGNVTYQWYKNNEIITGETGNSVDFTAAELSDSGAYHVVASNSAGDTTSNNATVTVEQTDLPAISQQPASTTAATGSSLSLAVVATSDDDITYQWYKNSEIITGEITSSIDFAATVQSDSGSYYVIATNNAGGTTSETAVVAIGPTLADYLDEQGVPQTLSDPSQDADNDGASNLLEYISKTDPTDPESRPIFKATLQTMEGSTYLEFEAILNTAILEYAVTTEFSDSIDFSTTNAGTIVPQQSNNQETKTLLARSSLSLGEGPLFARLAIQSTP